MKVQLRRLSTIKPYENNPRENDAAVDVVAASIREFGFRQPIVVDTEGVIIVGHVRYKAALKLELDKVPVHVAEGLSPEQIKAYRIADNKSAEFSTWDLPLLSIELSDLQAADYDLEMLGFSEDDLAELLNGDELAGGLMDPDEIPAPPDEAMTQPGDLWVLGNHRLLCGDSSKPDHVDRLLAGQTIQLVNTDPPYNVNVEPRSNNAIAAGKSSFTPTTNLKTQRLDVSRHPEKANATHKQLRAKDRPLENDFVSDEQFDRLLDAWFGNIARVLDPGRAFYIWGGYANCANYPPFLKKHKLYFSQAIIWDKEHPVLTRKDFMGAHEWCFYGWVEGAAHQYFGPNNATDLWQLTRAHQGEVGIGPGVRLESEDGSGIDVLPPDTSRRIRNVRIGDGVTLNSTGPATDVWHVKKISPTKMVHLTEKPVELAARAMQYSSKRGENVLDLFGGSGSTLIAAEQAGRHAFLMELDPLYCDVIVERWEKFAGGKAHLEKEKRNPRKSL